MSEVRTLTKPCEDCAWKGTYEMPGRCSNCGTDYTLVIPRSHDAPGSMLGWECEICDCRRVGVVPQRRPPADAVQGGS